MADLLIYPDWYERLSKLPFDYHPKKDKDGEAWYRADDVWACIETKPTIKTETKRGRWIWDDRYSDYFCSECNHYDLRMSNFCRNCGADMREEKSSN